MYRAIYHAVLRHVPAEAAHTAAFWLIKAVPAIPGAAPLLRHFLAPKDPSLAVHALGLDFPGPLGIAAGFDKDGEAVLGLAALGFAFVEVGTVTAQPQPGNPKPRMFRFPRDRALINRMGFNNHGAAALAARLRTLQAKPKWRPIIGVNIGKTKVVPEDSAIWDYVTSAKLLADVADYVVVNVSSPNTPGLRDLQSTEKLLPLLRAVRGALDTASPRRRVPLLVKIAPDLADEDIDDVADLALGLDLDGIIATNTTISRDGLTDDKAVQEAGPGGMSGAPLKQRSLEVLRRIRARAGDHLTIIAAGGIENAEDARERLDAGATLVQAYTAFIYEGPFWPRRVHRGLTASTASTAATAATAASPRPHRAGPEADLVSLGKLSRYGHRSPRAPVTAHSVRHSSVPRNPEVRHRHRKPRAVSRRTLSSTWLTWLDGTDPGLMRLQLAAEITLSIGAVLVAEWIFVRATGALQAPVPPHAPPAVAQQAWLVNHALMVIAMMLGAILAMISGFGVAMYSSARAQAITLLVLPVPMLAALALGLAVHVRMASLASLAVVLAVGTYCRRFGPRGFNGGVLAFMGAFLGFFIQDYVPLGEIGWLAAEIGLGTLVTLAVHLVFFFPRPGLALRRMRRSYVARARDVASEMAEVYSTTARSGEDKRAQARLQRHLLRLNEAALLIEAQLDAPRALPPGWSAAALHQRLFDAEVGLSNVARFALAIAGRGLPAPVTAAVGRALDGIREADFGAVTDSAAAIGALLGTRDREAAGGPFPGPSSSERSELTPTDRVLLHRFATSVTEYSAALRCLRLYPEGQAPDEEFSAQVTTFGGWLPGSSAVAGTASQERGGNGLIERIRLAPYARTAIQMGIAAGGAIALGDQLSGRRYYWALLAAFVTFMSTNTAGEQVRKATFRIAGTLVGVIAGAVLAHVVGNRVGWQLAVVLVSLFLGIYLFRVNYTFMTIGITVMVAQLYVEMDEFSNGLLLLRLEETSLGAGVAMLTAALVLPLHIGRVARVAAREQITALADLADRCLDRLADPASQSGSDPELRAAARRVDSAYHALIATVRPMRTPMFGRLAARVTGFLATAAAARHYSRNLLLDASTRYADLSPDSIGELAMARRHLAASVAAITSALAPARTPGRYVRSASLFAHIADGLPDQEFTSRPQLVLRDLQLLDAAFAEAARWSGAEISDLDTAY